ncbi:MAG: hypothetical protein DMD96_04330 [Candidatus Rokuibacteriota bacterium]|nr:MAG: hypothetical protein DMD96_04330 [Candidatus Rokubacteria bacterium]
MSPTTPIPPYAHGLDGLWGIYQWLDRAPKRRNETGLWMRRHEVSRSPRRAGTNTLRNSRPS